MAKDTKALETLIGMIAEQYPALLEKLSGDPSDTDIFVVCRPKNDSRLQEMWEEAIYLEIIDDKISYKDYECIYGKKAYGRTIDDIYYGYNKDISNLDYSRYINREANIIIIANGKDVKTYFCGTDDDSGAPYMFGDISRHFLQIGAN